ncbi:MAG: choice-of-anchor domain [Caulobacteraceae bacterium]|nr:choice-of-anchor domain [Caulobacteraceae bacterium]
MSDIVVAGGNNDSSFAVIDFTNPASPTKANATPNFLGGCMVDSSGTLAAAANFNGGQVDIFDISAPAVPVLKGSIATVLGGIGAISFDGSRVLVGELNGQRLILIDATNPAAPTILSTFTSAIDSISAVALKGHLAVASGPNNFFFVVLNYTNPASPTQVQFTPGTGGVFFNGSITCDLDGGRAAVADAGGGNVFLFDVSSGSPILLGQFVSSQAGVTSISISGATVAASSSNDFTVTLIDFSVPASPTHTDTPSNLGGGCVVKLSGSTLVAGAINGTEARLFSVSGTTATSLGVDNTMIASIATLGFSSFVPVTPVPLLQLSATSLAFGAVHVGVASAPQTLNLKNVGTAPLNVTQVKTSIAQYVVNPSGNLPAIPPGQTKALQVTFTPAAVQPYPAQLTMATNDTTHSTVSISLTGAGGLPHIVVSTAPFDLGSVAVCLTHTLDLSVQNTGTVDLHLTAIAVSGAGFSTSISTLTVPAGASGGIPLSLKPVATGSLAGSLTFNTDDPGQPHFSIALQGVGTPEPPPAIAVTPANIDFGAVPLQYFVGVGVTVANTGPCKDLHVNLSVSGAAYLLTTGDPVTLPMANPPIADTVAAGAANSYTVVFAPTVLGPGQTGLLTVTSDDPAHPTVTVPLTGTGVTVSPAAVSLVLDHSGSMATAITGGTRMTALHSAVSMFADLVHPGTGFAMGSVQFDSTASDLTPLANFDTAQQAQIKADANGLAPALATSIGAGLKVAQTDLTASGMARNVAIVFTDGYQNTAPNIETIEPGLLAAGIEVYAVGLGDPAYLSTPQLQSLAASSNGKFFQTTDPLVLRKQFVEVLADAFRQQMAVDPLIDLQQGVPLTIPVNITSCESRISFVLLWEDLAAQVQFTVRAPDGTTFGPGSGANNRLVRYVHRPGYRFLQITLPPGPNKTIGPKQLGVWNMFIDPVFVAGGTTRASTNVLVESELQIVARVQATTIGAPVLVRTRLTHAGSVVSKARVAVAVTSPLTSLASLNTPLIRHRAAAADVHHIPKSEQILTKTQVRHYEAKFNEREFLLELPAPRVDGVYHFAVTATGEACGGVFERYWSSSNYIGPKGRQPGRG